MNSWYHFIPERNNATVSSNKQQQSSPGNTASSTNSNTVVPQQQQQQDCFSGSSPSIVKASTSSIAVILPEKYDPSLEILRSLSAGTMEAITQSQSLAAEDSADAAEPTQIPRRNLTEAFEELYVQPSMTAPAPSNSETETPLVKQSNGEAGEGDSDIVANSLISPTGVMELDSTPQQHQHRLGSTEMIPPTTTRSKDTVVGKLDEKLGFRLHSSLQRDMSDALVQRVSFYAIIHDINKEASAMASNDDSGYDRQPQEDVGEEYDALIVAVNGYPGRQKVGGTAHSNSSLVNVALIDEEQWLLDAIDTRSSDEGRAINACPPTFPEAMGERDYENPLASLSTGSRTQLWKPSRSWWEAKSGKNPWIEPKCHNKRWR
jgi:hypothetical protein